MLELVPSAQRPRAAPMGGGIFNEAGVQTLLIVAEAFAAHLRAVSRSRRNEECKERRSQKCWAQALPTQLLQSSLTPKPISGAVLSDPLRDFTFQ